jgi:NADPH:quinone reductase-like Zn-dependent oxidoreductase
VFGTGIGNGASQGAYAEQAAVPVDRLVALPDGVDATAAGAVGVAGATAWRTWAPRRCSITDGKTFNTPDLRVPLRGIAHLMDSGALSVEIAETYGLEEAAEAQRAVLEDSFLGKLVVVP